MELSNYLLKSVAILSIFYMVYYLFLRKDTLFAAKRHYLLSGILASLFLPFLEFTKTIYKEATYVESISFSEAIPATAQVVGQTQEAFIINWWQLALMVYAIGVLIMGGRLLVQIHSLYKLIRTHPSEKIEGFNFVKVDRSVSPFSFFKYIVYNPSLHNKEELQMILKHEQIHVSQWHSIDIIVANVVRILQWVNPFSWYYKKSLEENLEFIADNETASRVPSKKQYQLTLVKASLPVHAPALTTQFYQSFTRLTFFDKKIILKKSTGQIKKRIIMLNKNTSKRRNIWKLSIVLPVLALFLWSFNVKEVVEYKEVTSPKIIVDNRETAKVITDGLEPSVEKEPILTNKVPLQNNTSAKEGSGTNYKRNSEESSIANDTQVNDVLTTIKVVHDPAKEVRFQITKNTTDAELENMKNELKTDHGIDLSYTVARNSNKEITSISLSYTSKNNNGSYNINGEGPIESFHFYMTDDGDSGFWSEENEIRREERALKRVKEMEERKVEREVRRAEMMGRRVEMMNRRMDDRRDEMDERRKEMIVIREGMEGRKREMKEREKEFIRRYKESSKAYGKAKTRSNSKDNVFIFSSDDDNVFNNTIMINKDTTDNELNKIKTKMKAKGITFNFSKVKRNEAGEITRIKITTNNGKGRKSNISIIGDDDEAIEEIFIEI
jgi:bla regulator protein blaR1